MIVTPALIIEYATTADMEDGQALPPLILDGAIWHIVRRMAGHTLWRRIFLADSGAYAVPRHGSRIDCGSRRSHAVARDRAAALATAVLQIVATTPEDEQREQLENYLRDELADIDRQAAGDRRLG
jgi:hypothetical protein